MDADVFALAYQVRGPEAMAYALIACLFGAWRKWIRDWRVLVLAMLPFSLVWPLLVVVAASVNREPVHPDAALMAQWFGLGMAVLSARLAKEAWDGVAKREQVASPWWKHLAAMVGVFFLIVALGECLSRLAGPSAVRAVAQADQGHFEQDGQSAETASSRPDSADAPLAALNGIPIADLQKLAEGGNVDAQLALGSRFAEGIGVRTDLVEAFGWYERAAAQGSADAQLQTGILLFTGKGVAEDHRAAAHWFQSAAAQGNRDAQYQIGVLLSEGVGVPKDDAAAFEWFVKAAQQGDRDAQNNLGYAYSMGIGVAKDDQLAVAWYSAAAEQGSALAQRNLATKLLDGRGVVRDEETAYMWLLLATAQGDEPARALLDQVEARLTPQQRASGQARARDWQPRGAGAQSAP